MSPIALHVVRSYIFFSNHLGQERFVGRLKLEYKVDSRSISFSIGWFFLHCQSPEKNNCHLKEIPRSIFYLVLTSLVSVVCSLCASKEVSSFFDGAERAEGCFLLLLLLLLLLLPAGQGKIS